MIAQIDERPYQRVREQHRWSTRGVRITMRLCSIGDVDRILTAADLR